MAAETGLELDEIFKTHPNIKVTGVDLTKAMLDVLKQKHPTKDLTLINASFFDYDFGIERFDAIISFQTMHPAMRQLSLRPSGTAG